MSRRITFQPISGGVKSYSFRSDGPVIPVEGTVEANDSITTNVLGTRLVEGEVVGLSDAYRFDGRLQDWDADPGIRVLIDGAPAAGATRPYRVEIAPAESNRFRGIEYEFLCTAGVTARSGVEPADEIRGKSVRGTLYDAPDEYIGRGGLLLTDIPPGVQVSVNGKPLDTRLTVTGGGGAKGHYRTALSGPCAAIPETRELDDWLAPTGARGTSPISEQAVGGYISGFAEGNFVDEYLMHGEVEYFQSSAQGDYSVSDEPTVYTSRVGRTTPIDVGIYQSRQLTQNAGRAPEQMCAKALRFALDEAGVDYDIRSGFRILDPPGQDFAACKNPALGWFRKRVRGNAGDLRYAGNDANILLVDDNSGGCSYAPGLAGLVGANDLSDVRPMVATTTSTDDDYGYYRTLYAFLHEVGHQMGAEHNPSFEGEKRVFAKAWRDEQGIFHKHPNYGGGGFNNACGEPVAIQRPDDTVTLHLTYNDCAVKNFLVR